MVGVEVEEMGLVLGWSGGGGGGGGSVEGLVS